jgi:hypothetical protein
LLPVWPLLAFEWPFSDHSPEMTCAAPWHAGMAFALGYMKAAMQAVL